MNLLPVSVDIESKCLEAFDKVILCSLNLIIKIKQNKTKTKKLACYFVWISADLGSKGSRETTFDGSVRHDPSASLHCTERMQKSHGEE